jgi:uncharacterized protein YndB with AHSA1/START domain
MSDLSLLQKSISINAPASRVWSTLIDTKSYSTWAAEFCSGSYYEGEMKPDGKIKFLAPDKSGLSSIVRVFEPNKEISFEHLGGIKDGQEDFDNPDFQSWIGARETYTLVEENGITTLNIAQDMSPNELEYFDKIWTKALESIKKLAEE